MWVSVENHTAEILFLDAIVSHEPGSFVGWWVSQWSSPNEKPNFIWRLLVKSICMTVNDLFSNSPPRVSHSLRFLFVRVCVSYDVMGWPGRSQSLIGYDHHCCCMITNHRLHTFTFPWIKDYHLLWWRGWSKEKFFSIHEWKLKMFSIRINHHWQSTNHPLICYYIFHNARF